MQIQSAMIDALNAEDDFSAGNGFFDARETGHTADGHGVFQSYDLSPVAKTTDATKRGHALPASTSVLDELEFVQPAVNPAPIDKFLVGSGFADAALVEDHYLIGAANGR